MFRSEQNVALGVAAVLVAPPTSDADWVADVRTVGDGSRKAHARARPVLFQRVRGAAMPSAKLRRDIAEMPTGARPDAVTILLSETAVVRHALTALDWLHKPHYSRGSKLAPTVDPRRIKRVDRRRRRAVGRLVRVDLRPH